MNSDTLLRADVQQLADWIRARDVSPIEVVDGHIARIEAFEPTINALAIPLLEQARAEARAAGERLVANPRTNGPLPPFLGVPFTSKEHYGIEGLPHTAGVVRRKGIVGTRTATVVQRMRDAGFVLLGTTNVPEALMWFESYNKVYGRTRNPWDPSRLPGGSSGGEGAVIGYGGSPVGLGGDVGGSIRNPAFFCGVCGHKPTSGLVPQTGAWPGARGKHARYRVSGPLARRVSDLQSVMPLITGPDGHDGSMDGPPWSEVSGPAAKRVLWFDGLDIAPPSDDVVGGLNRAVRALADAGHEVAHWRPPGLERVVSYWAGAMGDAGGKTFEENLGEGEPVRLRRELARWPLRRSRHIFPVLATLLLERATHRIRSRRPGDPEATRLALQAAIEAELGDDGVLVLPSFHRTAPRHGLDAVRATFGFLYCAFLNPLELPATQVPTGFGADGLPVGVQVVAARNRDDLCLSVARQIEETLGGWSPPPQLAER